MKPFVTRTDVFLPVKNSGVNYSYDTLRIDYNIFYSYQELEIEFFRIFSHIMEIFG